MNTHLHIRPDACADRREGERRVSANPRITETMLPDFNPDVAGWLVWSNEHNAWWGPGHCGYPHDIASAGRYTLAQAVDICTQRSWMRGHVPPETMIHESSVPHIVALAKAGAAA